VSVLVTGAAGYIGRAVANALASAGRIVVGFDLVEARGEGSPLPWTHIVGDVRDRDRLTRVMRAQRVEAVVHLAGKIVVSESVAHPLAYWDHNVGGGVALLSAMQAADVPILVFSSSAAVYGNPTVVPTAEHHPLAPLSPYGRTKLAMEWMLQDLSGAGALKWVALRYFNAAGAISGVTVEHHDPETHLIPNILTAAALGVPVAVYGDDYDTPDGTAVRDYVHVADLAKAHVLALEYLERGSPSIALNVATGQGYSVRQVVSAVERALMRPVPVRIAPRRPGDPAVLVGDGTAIREHLGFVPALGDIQTIVDSAVAHGEALS